MSGDLRTILLLAAACAACTASPGTEAVVPFEFVAPAADAVVTRDQLTADGEVVAALAIELSVPETVDSIELWVESIDGREPLGTIGHEAALELALEGPIRLRALGLGKDGVQIDEAVVHVLVEPGADTCQGWLDLYALGYDIGPFEQGVADPVTVDVPINGLTYRPVTSQSTRSSFFMDCEMALSLASAAPYLRRRGVAEVWDIGVYNYRCIGGGTPPDCPNGISQHAYAAAIDIAGFTTTDGTTYSVNDDWIIDSDATCTSDTAGPKDEFLHEVICDLKEQGVFNIVLTPNYNDAHRNHFHVDLTPGADFIRFEYSH